MLNRYMVTWPKSQRGLSCLGLNHPRPSGSIIGQSTVEADCDDNSSLHRALTAPGLMVRLADGEIMIVEHASDLIIELKFLVMLLSLLLLNNEHFLLPQMSLVYQDLLAKQQKMEKMAQQGKRQYEYDSDEDVDVSMITKIFCCTVL